MSGLSGKVAAVVGASRGIGKGIALELGAAGAHVVVIGRTRRSDGDRVGSLDQTVEEIEGAGGTASIGEGDMTDEAAVARLFAAVGAECGRLDILVNSAFNAASFGASIGVPFWELPLSAWREVVDVGTKSAYLATAAAAPALIGARGLVVNISGRGAERYRYNVAYGVGKAATDRLTRDTAADLREHGVAVVSLWPNVTRTENLERDPENSRARFGDLDAMETPRYIGRAVVALAGDPGAMDRTGRRFWVAELGAYYDLVDEHGRPHPLPE